MVLKGQKGGVVGEDGVAKEGLRVLMQVLEVAARSRPHV